MPNESQNARTLGSPPKWPAAVAWALAWGAMVALGDRFDLANKALILVLASAVAAIWWGPWLSVVAGAAAVLAFNFAFVPPRGGFTIDLHQHAILLLATLSVSWIVALLMGRLRKLAADARHHSLRSDQLRELGDTLREVDDPRDRVDALDEALSRLAGSSTTLLLASPPNSGALPSEEDQLVGAATADERIGLALCLCEGRAMGVGTGWHEEQLAWYLPLRGQGGTFGAALMRLTDGADTSTVVRRHAQALCDQMGAAMERSVAVKAAGAARELARSHALRNTLLSAISHDHRTPLATILSAASSLHDQSERLSPEQRRKLAATIVDEASQLSRLTDNTLQLARLGSTELSIHRDWESVEEIVGTVLRRARQRSSAQPVKVRVAPGLPLLRCDAVLMVQLVDNLVDNALKYGGGEVPVEVVARRVSDDFVIAVRDRGPGVSPAQREDIFETFQRAEPPMTIPDADDPPRRGVGVGLALCRAIARAHGGEVRLRPRSHGGSSFEVVLPVEDQPDVARQPDAEAGAP